MVEKSGQRARHEGGQGGARQRPKSQGGEIIPAGGDQSGDASHEDPHRSHVGKTTQGIGEDQQGAGGECLGSGHFTQLLVGHHLGQDDALAQKLGSSRKIAALQTQQPGQRGKHPAQNALKSERLAQPNLHGRRQLRQCQIQDSHQAQDRNQQGGDARGQL